MHDMNVFDFRVRIRCGPIMARKRKNDDVLLAHTHRHVSIVFYVFLFLRLFGFQHVERILFGYFRVILSLLAFVHGES